MRPKKPHRSLAIAGPHTEQRRTQLSAVLPPAAVVTSKSPGRAPEERDNEDKIEQSGHTLHVADCQQDTQNHKVAFESNQDVRVSILPAK